MKLELHAVPRIEKGPKTKSLRKKGIIPAVLYGFNVTAESLSVKEIDFKKVYKQAGSSSVVSVLVDHNGKKEEYPCLIYDVALDPIKNTVTHADFYRVNMEEKITATVPLVFVGESPAVKFLKGILVKNAHEVEVEALPANLPKEIKVDISKLAAFGDVVTIKDLPVEKTVVIRGHADDVLASVTEPRAEEVKKEEETPDLAAIKTEGEEKREEKAAQKEDTEEKK